MHPNSILRSAILGTALAATVFATATPVRAQASGEEAAADAGAPPADPGPDDPYDRGTPHGAVVGYLSAAREGDFERAAQYLDLSRLPQRTRGRSGPALARELKIVLDQTLWVEVDDLSQDAGGRTDDGLARERDLVGHIDASSGRVDVLVQRVRRPDGARIWKIASDTVDQVPALYDEFGVGEVGKLFPSSLHRVALFDLQLWQWLALLVAVVLAAAASWAFAFLAVRLTRPLARLSRSDVDDRLLELAVGPIRLGIALAVFSAGFRLLALAIPAQAFLSGVVRALGILALVWFLLRLIDMAAEVLRSRLVAAGQASAVGLVPPGRKMVKAVLVAIGAVAMLDNIGFDVTALVAGLGVGGLAVALAAQKTVENLFGGLTLYADRPVRVGDFCRFGDRVGTVEEIGLRSTRVRTLDRTVVSIPNAEFSRMELENFAPRDRILYRPTLGLRYETTPEQLRYVLVEVRRMLYSHPRVSDDPARVRFASFGDFSLDLEVFAYVQSADWNEYLGIAEDLNLRIMDIVETAGSGFAFPSSTAYVAHDTGLDADKAGAAERQVAAWREAGELHLPQFPPQVVGAVRASLPWPPEGASSG